MPAEVSVRLARGASEEDYKAAVRAADAIAQALTPAEKSWIVGITQADDSGDWNVALSIAGDDSPMWGLGFAGPKAERPGAIIAVTLPAHDGERGPAAN